MSEQLIANRRLRVVITGGTGVVGTALAAELRAAGYETVIPLSQADGDLANQAEAETAIARARPDIVYHLAARVHGIMGNLRTQGESYLANIRINTNVIEAARRAGARKIVAMGSTAIYSDQVPRPMREADLWLGAPHGSEAGYAHAKRAMLAQLGAYHEQYGLDYAFCIATNMFGPNDRFDEQNGHVIPSLLSKFERAIRNGEPVEVWGTGTPRRDFLFSHDAAHAMRLVGERFTGPINLATGKAISIADMVEAMVRVTGFPGSVIWDRSKPDGQMLRDYDVGQLRALGFEPVNTLDDALRTTFAWLRDHAGAARR
jgi:GDP-L-fucose synthase